MDQNQFRDSQDEGNKPPTTSPTEKHLCQGKADREAANIGWADTQTAV